jgi:hypothetical protein
VLPIESNLITVKGKISAKIYKTQNITQSAEGNKDGLWITIVTGYNKSCCYSIE